MAIYAIDFDNTLAITRFPEIVAPNKKMVAFAKAVKAQGHQIILWTSRAGADLESRGVVQIAKGLYLMP